MNRPYEGKPSCVGAIHELPVSPKMAHSIFPTEKGSLAALFWYEDSIGFYKLVGKQSAGPAMDTTQGDVNNALATR